MNYWNKAKEKATTQFSQTAEKLRKTVEEKGGLGKIVEDATVSLSEQAGKAAGHIAKAVDGAINYKGNDLDLRKIYDSGTVNVDETAQKAKDLATKGVTKTKAAGENIATVVKQAANDVKGALNDLPLEEERYISVGSRTYHVRSYSKAEITNVKDYMTDISKKIPSATAGRQEVLTFIADNAISTDGRLAELWEKKKMPDMNAIRYVKQ